MECPRITPKRTQVTGWLRPGAGTAHFSWVLLRLLRYAAKKLGRNRGGRYILLTD